MAALVTLVYLGGSTLSFGTGSGRRVIGNGIPFQVEQGLAAILLRDPHVSLSERAEPELSAPAGVRSSDGASDVPRETSLAEMSKVELLAAAGTLGLVLPKRATNPAIALAIEAEQKRLADEAAADAAAETSSDGGSDQGGDATPGDDPDAAATGEPGTPPSNTGAVTLGDLPAGAKLKGA